METVSIINIVVYSFVVFIYIYQISSTGETLPITCSHDTSRCILGLPGKGHAATSEKSFLTPSIAVTVPTTYARYSDQLVTAKQFYTKKASYTDIDTTASKDLTTTLPEEVILEHYIFICLVVIVAFILTLLLYKTHVMRSENNPTNSCCKIATQSKLLLDIYSI